MEASAADTAIKAGDPAPEAGIPGDDEADYSLTDSPKAGPPSGQAPMSS